MPRIDAVVSSKVTASFRTHQLAGMFDLPVEAENGYVSTESRYIGIELPGLDEPWQIGLIVGPSGSGKTTIARKAFGDFQNGLRPWPVDRAVIDCLGDYSIRTISQALTAVGFSSPPAWLRPYQVLSNGEKFRCDLARLLLQVTEDGSHADAVQHDSPVLTQASSDASGQAFLQNSGVAVMDEFTSVVDRQVARVGSAAVANALRATWAGDGKKGLSRDIGHNRRFVAVSCHYDIVDWLCPDWVLDMVDQTLTRRLLRRPEIELSIHRCGKEVWNSFKRHHYLSNRLPVVARCYVGVIAGEAVAFAAISSVVGFTGYWRMSRVVVLPDYQGIGIGGKFRDAVAQIEMASGRVKRLSLVTSHPAMIRSMGHRRSWRMNTRAYAQRSTAATGTRTARRIIVSMMYVPQRYPQRDIPRTS